MANFVIFVGFGKLWWFSWSLVGFSGFSWILVIFWVFLGFVVFDLLGFLFVFGWFSGFVFLGKERFWGWYKTTFLWILGFGICEFWVLHLGFAYFLIGICFNVLGLIWTWFWVCDLEFCVVRMDAVLWACVCLNVWLLLFCAICLFCLMYVCWVWVKYLLWMVLFLVADLWLVVALDSCWIGWFCCLLLLVALVWVMRVGLLFVNYWMFAFCCCWCLLFIVVLLFIFVNYALCFWLGCVFDVVFELLVCSLFCCGGAC